MLNSLLQSGKKPAIPQTAQNSEECIPILSQPGSPRVHYTSDNYSSTYTDQNAFQCASSESTFRLFISVWLASVTITTPPSFQFANPLLATAAQTCAAIKFALTPQTCQDSQNVQIFPRIENMNAFIRPNTLTLIIGAPGSGRSTYLKLLSNRLQVTSGEILYNNHTIDEYTTYKCDVNKMIRYIDQIDYHNYVLTCRETIEFSYRQQHRILDNNFIDTLFHDFHMDECMHTPIYAISGGQAKRLNIMNALTSPNIKLLCLDQYTDGLDSSTALLITEYLTNWVKRTSGSIVATIQQPSPSICRHFDRIVILRQGNIIFDGPREDTAPYLAAMGYVCPDDIDLPSFIVDVTTFPKLLLSQQMISPEQPKYILSSGEAISTIKTPCVTTQEMLTFWRQSPLFQSLTTQMQRHRQYMDYNKSLNDFSPYVTATYPVHHILPYYQTLYNVTKRQYILQRRNISSTLSRFFPLITVGLLFGGYYFQLPTFSFILYMASFLDILTEYAYNNLGELGGSIWYKRILNSESHLYPPSAHVLATHIIFLPFCLLETLVFSLIVYPLIGFPFHFETILNFYVISAAISFVLSSLFRWVASFANNIGLGYAIVSPVISLLALTAGFYIRFENLPIFLRWVGYLSPFHMGLGSLLNSMWSSSTFDYLVPDPSHPSLMKRAGDVYLALSGFTPSSYWFLWTMLYCIAALGFFLSTASYFLSNPWAEYSRGTSRLSLEDEECDFDGDAASQSHPGDNSSIPILDHKSSTPTQTANRSSPSIHKMRSSPLTTSPSEAPNVSTLTSSLPFVPTSLFFNNLSFSIPTSSSNNEIDATQSSNESLSTTYRPLLQNVSGYVKNGQLLAILGATASGKTTLLNSLYGTNNNSNGHITGTISLNSTLVFHNDDTQNQQLSDSPAAKQYQNAKLYEWSSIVGYVEQQSQLFPYDSVYNTLLFAARMKLPCLSRNPDHPALQNALQEVIHEVIDILGLGPIQHKLIGSPENPSLSPSQLKLVSIGVILVGNPAVVMLDEPTSGLSSQEAFTVIRAVRRIADAGRSVICTIHQPSASIFYMFDTLLLLASGGNQVYFGPIGQQGKMLTQYFSQLQWDTDLARQQKRQPDDLDDDGSDDIFQPSNLIQFDSNIDDDQNANDDDDDIDEFMISPSSSQQQIFSSLSRITHRCRGNPAEWVLTLTSLPILNQVRQTILNQISQHHLQPQSSAFDQQSTQQQRALWLRVQFLSSQHFQQLSQHLSICREAIDLAMPSQSHHNISTNTKPSPLLTPSTAFALINKATPKDAAPSSDARLDQSVYTQLSSEQDVQQLPTAHPHSPSSEDDESYILPLSLQFSYLFPRMQAMYLNTPSIIIMRLTSTVCISILYALLYGHISITSPQTVITYLAATTSTAGNAATLFGNTALPHLRGLRSLMYRETKAGYYRPAMYTFVTWLCEAIWLFPLSLPTFIIHFLVIVGGHTTFTMIIQYWILMYFVGMVFVSFAQMCAVTIPKQGQAESCMNMYVAISFILGGVSQPLSQMNVVFATLARFFPFLYVNGCICASQFTSGPLGDTIIQAYWHDELQSLPLREFISWRYQFDASWYNHGLCMLGLMIIVFQSIAMWAATKVRYQEV